MNGTAEKEDTVVGNFYFICESKEFVKTILMKRSVRKNKKEPFQFQILIDIDLRIINFMRWMRKDKIVEEIMVVVSGIST